MLLEGMHRHKHQIRVRQLADLENLNAETFISPYCRDKIMPGCLKLGPTYVGRVQG